MCNDDRLAYIENRLIGTDYNAVQIVDDLIWLIARVRELEWGWETRLELCQQYLEKIAALEAERDAWFKAEAQYYKTMADRVDVLEAELSETGTELQRVLTESVDEHMRLDASIQVQAETIKALEADKATQYERYQRSINDAKQENVALLADKARLDLLEERLGNEIMDYLCYRGVKNMRDAIDAYIAAQNNKL